jgi:hypothetical protein
LAAIEAIEDVSLLSPEPVLESDNLKLTLIEGEHMFEVYDKKSGDARKFGFEMRYWNGY